MESKKPPLIPFPEFHSEVNSVAKTLYESGHFTDALRKASIKLEEKCKEVYREKTAKEASGVTLMTKLFCENKGEAILPMFNLSSTEGADRQKSIYFLFSGCIGAIRNPLAHESADLEEIEALYGLNVVSYLFYKLDVAIKLNSSQKNNYKPEEIVTDYLTTSNSTSLESNLIKIILADTHIKSISSQTNDQSNAKLSIEKRAQELITENLETIGEETYNLFFSDKNFQEKIYSEILRKIYE